MNYDRVRTALAMPRRFAVPMGFFRRRGLGDALARAGEVFRILRVDADMYSLYGDENEIFLRLHPELEYLDGERIEAAVQNEIDMAPPVIVSRFEAFRSVVTDYGIDRDRAPVLSEVSDAQQILGRRVVSDDLPLQWARYALTVTRIALEWSRDQREIPAQPSVTVLRSVAREPKSYVVLALPRG